MHLVFIYSALVTQNYSALRKLAKLTTMVGFRNKNAILTQKNNVTKLRTCTKNVVLFNLFFFVHCKASQVKFST